MVLVEVDGRSNDKGVSGTLDKTHLIGNYKAKDTHSRQQSFSRIQEENTEELHYPTGAPGQPPKKPRGKSHPDIQKPLQSNPGWSRRLISNAIMGQAATSSRTHPKLIAPIQSGSTISVWQYVHGNFDYNRMPLAPMGCAVQLFQNSEKRTSWGANAIDGWYLQTSPEHYRCHVIYVKQTKSERVSDTVFFKAKYITEPTLTPADVITKALNDLTQALK